MNGGYNVELDGDRPFRADLKGWEALDRADAERMRLLDERLAEEAVYMARKHLRTVRPEVVRIIRKLRDDKAASIREIGEALGVSVSVVGDISLRKKYQDVPDVADADVERRAAEVLLAIREKRRTAELLKAIRKNRAKRAEVLP